MVTGGPRGDGDLSEVASQRRGKGEMVNMKRMSSWSVLSVALAALATGCNDLTEVRTTDLAETVHREGVPFVVDAFPQELIDRLSSHRVVVVGETHHIKEHGQMMAELVRVLYSRGFRQLLVEWPQAADWLLADFVQGHRLLPDWEPPPLLGGGMITAIRDFNRSLPEGERFQVRAIDVNLSDYGGSDSFVSLLGVVARYLPNPGPLEVFLRGRYYTPERQNDMLDALRRELEAGRRDLAATWGEYWYGTVVEMVEVERASVAIRSLRADHYELSVRLRENVMKRLADLRLEGYEHRTLINVGANHAQKEHLRGTDQEWLGDYLVHRSVAAGRSVFVLAVLPARGEPGSGGAIADWDLLHASPENELFRLMNETWPDRIVYLPLDDPLFTNGGVPMNFEGQIHVSSPKRQYDAFVLLPLVHYTQPPSPSGALPILRPAAAGGR